MKASNSYWIAFFCVFVENTDVKSQMELIICILFGLFGDKMQLNNNRWME